MSNFIFYSNPTMILVCTSLNAPSHHSLASAAQLTGVHPEMLRYYCRVGLVNSGRGVLGDEPTFDDDALEEVVRIEHYRRHLGVGRRALPLVCELRREGERRQVKLRFLECP